jgi:capsular polysaccharide biosynthesis protein
MNKTLLIVVGAIMIVVAPLSYVAGIAYTFTLPKIYSGEARIQVVFPEHAQEKYDAAVLSRLTQTQAELIPSAPLLTKTIQNLNLQGRWGRQLNEDGARLSTDMCRTIMSKCLRVATIPGTSGLISITVLRQDPGEAAVIANELAAVYREGMKDKPQQGGTYQVLVVSPAEPALRPVSPNLFLNMLVSLGAAGLLCLGGIVLVVIGARMKRKVQQ